MTLHSEGRIYIVCTILGVKSLWIKCGRGSYHHGMRIRHIKDL